MTAPDPHEVLGVTRGTPPAALKACYRKLAKRYHPDVNGQDPTAEWVFKQVRAAYVTLCVEAEVAARPDAGTHNGRPAWQQAREEPPGRRDADTPHDRGRGRDDVTMGALLDGWFGWVFAAAAAGIAGTATRTRRWRSGSC